jgi:8-amino-7-oxononanoate synthase
MTFDSWLQHHQEQRDAAGLDRQLRPREPDSTLIELAGNDYLGLSHDARVTSAAAEAARVWGAGAGASRLVTGTLTLHCELEDALAAWTGNDMALTLSTGYHANLSVVTALTDAETLIVSDAHIHASLVDACRLARPGALVVTPHNDAGAVAAALRDRSLPRAVVLAESIYSVLGDAAPITELAGICEEYDAVLIVDEAHAIGVAGIGGRGLVAASGLTRRSTVVTTLTLSKALGSQGGAVLGSQAVVDRLVNVARPFIFDTGLAPAAAAAALAAVHIVTEDPVLPQRACELACRFSTALGIERPAGAVLAVPMPGPREAMAAQASLAEDGIRVGCFRPPSVPDGVSRLRLAARASLTDSEVETVADRLAQVGDRR